MTLDIKNTCALPAASALGFDSVGLATDGPAAFAGVDSSLSVLVSDGRSSTSLEASVCVSGRRSDCASSSLRSSMMELSGRESLPKHSYQRVIKPKLFLAFTRRPLKQGIQKTSVFCLPPYKTWTEFTKPKSFYKSGVHKASEVLFELWQASNRARSQPSLLAELACSCLPGHPLARAQGCWLDSPIAGLRATEQDDGPDTGHNICGAVPHSGRRAAPGP